MSRTSSSQPRLIFVDVLRSLAIGLALTAHALNDFNIPSQLSENGFIIIRSVTRAATPSFIFLFGMMMELVYARKLKEVGPSTIVPKLIWRSLQCYFGYLITVSAGFVAGLFDITHALQAAVFIFGGHHGNILKFYTVALVVAIPLLILRNRVGLFPILILCLSMWGFSPLLKAVNSIHVGRFNGLLELLVQMIPFSLTFIGAGMFAGTALRNQGKALVRSFYRHTTTIGAICLAIVGFLVWKSSPGEVLHAYLDYYEYRQSYHIGYYAIGLLQTIGLCLLFFHLFPPPKQQLSPRSFVLSFGRSSLLSFTLGNVVLNFAVGHVNVPPSEGLWLTGGYLLLVLMLVNVQEQILRQVRRRPSLKWALRPVEFLQSHVAHPVSKALLNFAHKARHLSSEKATSLFSRRSVS